MTYVVTTTVPTGSHYYFARVRIYTRCDSGQSSTAGAWIDFGSEDRFIRLSWVKYEHNSAPNTPSTPSGPTSGYRNVWYTYSTSTTDPDGDNVRYQFEFTGPSTNASFTTGWYVSGQTGSITVMWETTDPLGTYQIRARAQDVYEEWSNWSPYLTVNIVNRPRYFRGDQQTINGLLAYILGTSQSSTLQVASGMASGRLAVVWSSDVVVRHADGSETTIGTKIAQVSRATNTEGIQSASWTCLLTNVVPTDAVVIKVYDKYGAAGAWNLRATFITEQLGASQLDNVAWTFYYYTYRLYDGSDTYGDFMWGTSTYNSRMENFTWTPVMT
jgi:hypothetical protein